MTLQVLLPLVLSLMTVWWISAAQVQSPPVWDSLAILQGKRPLTSPDIYQMFLSAIPGQDFPILSSIPITNFKCSGIQQSGFFADVDTRCQVVRRCDTNGNQWSYLCPNMTVFNQITLICDWWYNVDCSQSIHFYDYSNSRLYKGQDINLLDNQMAIEITQMVEDNSPPVTKQTSSQRRKSSGA